MTGSRRVALLGPGAFMLLMSVAGAQERPVPQRPVPDLKQSPAGQRVSAVRYCRGRFDVALASGDRRTFGEYDLSFKVDTSDHGPPRGAPSLVPAGRVGDRAIVVFASVEELTRGVWRAADCPDRVQ